MKRSAQQGFQAGFEPAAAAHRAVSTTSSDKHFVLMQDIQGAFQMPERSPVLQAEASFSFTSRKGGTPTGPNTECFLRYRHPELVINTTRSSRKSMKYKHMNRIKVSRFKRRLRDGFGARHASQCERSHAVTHQSSLIVLVYPNCSPLIKCSTHKLLTA